MPFSPSSYLMASVAVGLAQVVDAVVHLRKKNSIAGLTVFFSLAEYAWAGVSFFVWRQAEAPFPYWLPVSFIAYVLAFMAAGFFLAATQPRTERVIPDHLSWAGGLFGAYFAVAALLQA